MRIARKYSEREIIESIQSGNNFNEVVRYLYMENYRKVVSYIMQNSGNEEDGQDNFQEVIVTFVEVVKQDKFRGESSVSTFLLALARNIWLNELKKRGRSQLREENFEKSRSRVDEDISQFLTHHELRKQVMDLLSEVGTTCKKILVAFYYENLSMKEILQQLDYENEQVVRNKKYKCLKQLEQVLAGKPSLANNLKSILSYE